MLGTSDLALFSRLYIVCQTRGGNLEEFFRHENQPWPSSLAKLGDLRSGSKADLVISLISQTRSRALPGPDQLSNTPADDDAAISHSLDEVPTQIMDDTTDFMITEDPFEDSADVLDEAVLVPVSTSMSQVDAKVLDGAAVIQMLSPKLAKTFQDYVDQIVLPYILRQFETASRIDLVLNVYSPESLKASARERRGRGCRRRVLPSAQLPGNWKGFL